MGRPWMPFYVADYLADTAHLTTLQHGAYVLLLLSYWKRKALPKDEQQLQQIARMTADEWRTNRDTLADFFTDGWKHQRMEAEIAKSDDISAKRANAAKQKHINSSANAEQKDTPSQSPSQSPSPSKKDSREFDVKEVKFPRHGATAKLAGGARLIYFKRGTMEFAAYSADFQDAKGELPEATSDGRWFKVLGEQKSA